MLLSISDFFIRRPVFATVCSVVITLLGAACIFIVPILYIVVKNIEERMKTGLYRPKLDH
jgi:multidrug efflux pump subunit AcrB